MASEEWAEGRYPLVMERRARVDMRAGLSRLLDTLEFHRAFDVEDRLEGALRVQREALAIGATDLQMRGRLVEADVRTVHARLQRLYAAREPLVRTRDLAKDTLDIIERRYRNGEALILDYLDAQFDLLNADIDLADSGAAIAQTWGELWAATGRIPGAH